MLNISRGRSSSVPQNRFLRRLILHFDLLQDETATMNQATTILFLLVNLYIQIVPTNNTVDSSLNMLLGSAKMVPTIFSAGLFVSIILLLILLVSLIFENKYLDRNCTLDPPKHLKSVWYKFYKHLFRFHFLLLEPILSGYTLSLILPKSAFDVYPLRFQVFAIVGGTLGLLLSIPYFCLVESILPSSSWTSATNKYNIALTTIGLRLCIFLDYVYTSATDMALIGILMVIRISPSIIATYINLFATHFFNKHARVLFVGYQVSNIIYSIIFFVMGNDSTSLTLIPACFFIALGLRAVYNMDLMSRANLQHLSANKLSDILTLASHITDSQKENVVSASTEALRFQAVMAHLTSGRKELYEEYCETFASTDEKAHDNERNTSLFMVYLFERCWQSSGQKDFRTLVYETLFALTMRLNLFHISTMLARLHSLDLNVVEQSTLRALIRRIELSAKEIYLDKLSLIPVREQFYAPKSVAETNEAIANKLKLNNIEDDSRDYGDQAKTHVTAKVIRSSDLLHFDIYSSMQTIEQYEKLVNRMQDVIFTILKFYDKLKNRVVDVANAHETMKRIKILKEKVNKAFRTLDKSSGDQNIFHLLPYALFLETINNDRQASQKVLKAYEHRSQLLERSMNMSRGRTSSSKFSLDQMLCISVDCTRNSLGRMNYISSNSEEVFGLHPKHFEGRNIHTLMSDDFQTIHDEFLDKFVKDQDKPYLGVSRERHVRVHDNVYTKCDVLVKLSPVLNPTSLSFMCLLKKRVNDEEFIVINHQGVIIGRSQALDWADALLRQSFYTLASALSNKAQASIKKVLAKNTTALSKVKMLAEREINTVTGKTERQDIHSANLVSREERRHSQASSLTFKEEEATSVKEEDSMDEEYGKLNRLKIKPIRFDYNSKILFTELLVRLARPGEHSLTLQATREFGEDGGLMKQPKSTGSLSENIPESLRIQPGFTPVKSKTLRLRQQRSGVGNDRKVSTHVNTIRLPEITTKIDNRFRSSTGAPLDRQKARLHNELVSKNTSKGKHSKYQSTSQKPAKLIIREHLDEMIGRAEADDPDKWNDAGSSVLSSIGAAHNKTARAKMNVLATMKLQRRRMAYKELAVVIFFQVLIWSFNGYTIFELTDSFGPKLENLIELRTGFGKMTSMMSSAFQVGILMMESMLVARGRISANKFKPILPSVNRTSTTAVRNNIVRLENWSNLLEAHIYSFDYEKAKRYLIEEYNHTYYYGDVNTSNKTSTKKLNLIDYTRELHFGITQWSNDFERSGRNLSFASRDPRQYYDLVDKGYNLIFAPTIQRIINTDTENYQEVLTKVTTLSEILSVLCMCFALLSMLVLWRLRRKTVGMYGLLEGIYPFEVQLMKDRLRAIDNGLQASRYSEPRCIWTLKRLSENVDSAFSEYRESNEHCTYFFKTKVDAFAWLGIGWLTLFLFCTVLVYETASHFTTQKVGTKLDRLLLLQNQQRLLMSATNRMSAINFNAYFMAAKAAGYGNTTLPPFNETIAKIEIHVAAFKEFIEKFDPFVMQIQGNTEDSLNFGDVLTAKPCNYVNLTYYSIPRSECEAVADYTFNTSALATYRWVRAQMPGLSERLASLNNNSDPISFLISKEFLTFEFIRRNFFVDFLYELTTNFFVRLKAYHNKMIVFPLRSILVSTLLVSLVGSLIGVACLSWTALNNIKAGVQIFLLIPPESYYHNPHIAAKLLTITR